nr:3-hydroxyacyl-CoA dehydrogenase NAD-binding domain-containing protein [Caldimonas sp.]
MASTIGSDTPVFVVGAGIMGAGIAQVAAQAGHAVQLFDTREGAAASACARLATTLDGLAAKGRLDAAEAKAIAARVGAATTLADAARAGVVVEAIVESLDAKRALFRELEAIVGERTILASNTSSISITALAKELRSPGRFVGMHFFNPVPLMKLVEVVSGLATDADTAAAIFDLAKRWGKMPVHARSTPGFIVNRIARPYYAEALALLHERLAEPATIDACLRGAGFRMGPCELMDLIGHDTNFAVTQSVFDANFGDKRYQPSLVQREMVDGGLLGRKSGRGFFAYPPGAPASPADAFEPPRVPAGAIVALHGRGVAVDRWAARLVDAGVRFEADPSSRWMGLQTDSGELRLTDGRAATHVAAEAGVRDLAVFDLAIA